METSGRGFWKIAFLIALAAAALQYAPVFIGRVPFPSQVVFDFPPFAATAPAIDHKSVANIGDVVSVFYPYRKLFSRTIREGFPLWDPYAMSGTPFLANPQSALLYPPNWLYIILPTPVAWSICLLLRSVLSFLFTVALVRRVGGSATGSIASALLFTFCGFMTVWQGQTMGDTAAWLPLIFYSVVLLHSEPRARSVALAAFAFAMPVLAGHPETAAHLILAGILLAGFLALYQPEWRFIWCFSAAGVLAFGVAAVQIVPTAEWLQYLLRGLNDEWPPLPVRAMLGFISRDVLQGVNSVGLNIPEEAAYIGMMAFVTAPLALLKSSRKFVIFLVALSAVCLLIIFGVNPVFGLTHYIPVFKSLKNGRLILIVSFSAAVLAGLGISAVEDLAAGPRGRRTRAIALAGAGCVVAALMINWLHNVTTAPAPGSMRLPLFSLLFLVASALPVVWKVAGGLQGRRFQVAILAVLAVDLLTFSYGFMPFEKADTIFPSIPLFERLQTTDVTPFRIAQLGAAYMANSEMMYGLNAVGGYEIPLTRLKAFLGEMARDEGDSVMLRTDRVLDSKDRRADLLNTKYYVVSEWDPRFMEFRNQPERFKFLFAYGETDVVENLNALPPAFLVPARGITPVPDEAGQLDVVKSPSFDPRKTVVLDQAVQVQVSAVPPASLSPPEVTWVSRRTSELELKAYATDESILVLSQTYYPGWKAWVDGVQTPVLRADYALSGIAISRGLHEVRFSFEPWSFRVGLLLSLVSVAALAALCVRKNGDGN